MDDSPLGNLSGEVKNRIYEFVFAHGRGLIIGHNKGNQSVHTRLETNTKLQDALAFTQLCKELRLEARFFEYNSICFTGFDLFLPRGKSQPSAAAWLREFSQVPPHLINDRTSFGIHALWDVTERGRKDCRERLAGGKTFGLPIKQLLDVINPQSLFLEIEFRTHKWAEVSSPLPSDTIGKMYSRPACKNGVPLSCNDCGLITYRVQLGDPAKAREEIRQRLEVRAQGIKSHAEHKACPIRREIPAMLEGLEESHKVMKEVIDFAMESVEADGSAAESATASAD